MTRDKLYDRMLRHEIIKCECRGKNVLDVGCANPSMGVWLHGEIAEVANRCVGIDVDAKGIGEIKKRGYDVHLADAENFHLGEKFEVAVLGELIEHLSNPGKVLDNVRGHLKSKGKMIVTTPNPYNPSVFIGYELQDFERDLEGSTPMAHVAYYTPSMFGRLAKRHGFEERKVVWIKEDLREPQTIKGKVFVALGRFLIPDRFAAWGWLGIYSRGVS